MGTTLLGKVALTPRGAWDVTQEYDKLDLVTNNGSSYLALQVVPVGTPLTNGTYWSLLVQGYPVETSGGSVTNLRVAGEDIDLTAVDEIDLGYSLNETEIHTGLDVVWDGNQTDLLQLSGDTYYCVSEIVPDNLTELLENNSTLEGSIVVNAGEEVIATITPLTNNSEVVTAIVEHYPEIDECFVLTGDGLDEPVLVVTQGDNPGIYFPGYYDEFNGDTVEKYVSSLSLSDASYTTEDTFIHQIDSKYLNGAVLYDTEQSLEEKEKSQARLNLGIYTDPVITTTTEEINGWSFNEHITSDFISDIANGEILLDSTTRQVFEDGDEVNSSVFVKLLDLDETSSYVDLDNVTYFNFVVQDAPTEEVNSVATVIDIESLNEPPELGGNNSFKFTLSDTDNKIWMFETPSLSPLVPRTFLVAPNAGEYTLDLNSELLGNVTCSIVIDSPGVYISEEDLELMTNELSSFFAQATELGIDTYTYEFPEVHVVNTTTEVIVENKIPSDALALDAGHFTEQQINQMRLNLGLYTNPVTKETVIQQQGWQFEEILNPTTIEELWNTEFDETNSFIAQSTVALASDPETILGTQNEGMSFKIMDVPSGADTIDFSKLTEINFMIKDAPDTSFDVSLPLIAYINEEQFYAAAEELYNQGVERFISVRRITSKTPENNFVWGFSGFHLNMYHTNFIIAPYSGEYEVVYTENYYDEDLQENVEYQVTMSMNIPASGIYVSSDYFNVLDDYYEFFQQLDSLGIDTLVYQFPEAIYNKTTIETIIENPIPASAIAGSPVLYTEQSPSNAEILQARKNLDLYWSEGDTSVGIDLTYVVQDGDAIYNHYQSQTITFYDDVGGSCV